jgi:glycosyltransferase involved in cell wall biosynthesis
MKALLLVTELEDYSISFANGLVRHVNVIFGVPRRRYAHLARWLDPAVDLRLLDWPRHRSMANLPFTLELTRLVRREQPSLVHLLSNTTVWLNLAAPFWRPIPLLTTVHDVQVHPGDHETRVLPGWATNLIVRQSDHVVVHGEKLKRLAVDHFGKAPESVHVLSHPAIRRYADIARQERLERRTEGRFTVLLFGRIFAYKGLEQLVRAECALGDRIPGLRIVIAGRGDDPWLLRGLMGDPTRYEVHNRFIEDGEVARLFLDADLAVLPYLEASQSGVLNLAAAFGMPVVATDVGELRETVESNRIGLVVPPNDPDRLADAIVLMAERADLRVEFGRNAQAWSEGPNAPEAVGAQAAELYRLVTRCPQ